MIRDGDVAWVMMASALVLFMTPGLALFYGGLVRQKNVITTLYQVVVVAFVITVQWVLFGYSLAFGPDVGHVIGNLDEVLLNGVGLAPNPQYAAHIPALLFALFQMMFAIITPAVIVGGLAERVRFSSFIVFVLLWSTLIYDPLAHWVWGAGGWLHQMGILDFAGGTVVEVSSGISGLMCAMYLGRRTVHGKETIRAHNIPLMLVGASILWFGWFGFNAGSALAANGLAVTAFFSTAVAGCTSALAWMVVERARSGHASLAGACAGLIAGLVAITPACGFVSVGSALVIGLVAGVISFFFSTAFKHALGYDDALDAFGAHGIGGLWGLIATGLFAALTVNPDGANGLLFGDAHTEWVELLGLVVTCVLSLLGTWVLLKVVDVTMGLRVTPEEEKIGLDIVLHNENAYPEQLNWDVATSIAASLGAPRDKG